MLSKFSQPFLENGTIEMTIQFYELAAKNTNIKFSPFVWRTRMALLHKGLNFESIAWQFKDRGEHEHKTVPAIYDDGKMISDSFAIAKYLDAQYPDKPALMNGAEGEAHAQLVNSICNNLIFANAASMALYPVSQIIDEESAAYFIETRESKFGKKLSEINNDDSEAAKAKLTKGLAVFESTLATSDYLGGDKPTYADYTLFGVLKWIDVVAYRPVDETSNVGKWFDRVSALYNGDAAKAPTVNNT